MDYQTTTLQNGLRVIMLPSKSRVVYCGFQVAAGTRNEAPGEEGLAHLCEHGVFKGTERRTAMQILNCLESVGGELNAFTTKEGTVFYAAVLKENLAKAVDLLTDMVFRSNFPAAEMEKEKEVVCDEIESYNDSPADLIFDEFENILFKGHPIGHNILGSSDRVRSYTPADAMRFTRRFYRPDNMVFFASGDVEFAKLQKLLTKAMVGVEKPVTDLAAIDDKKVTLAPYERPEGGVVEKKMDTHQAHVMIGTRAYDIHHPKRIALYLLNNILGGPGMNARLNLSLRERNGLVYSVESTMVSYGDTGLWCVYFGCDPKDVSKCRRLVRQELDKLMKKELSATKVSAAKRQIKGQIGVACDNREQFALDFGKSFLHYGWEKDVERLYAQIDAVTPQMMHEVAQELFAEERLTTLILH